MITYNDIYEAKKNQLVLFKSPQNIELWHFLVASDECHIASLGDNEK